MSYPLTCFAGFNVPIRQGKWRITGISAAVADPTADSAIMIVDDNTIKDTDEIGKIIATEDDGIDKKKVLAYIKGDGSSFDTNLEWYPSEPVKTLHGISIYTLNTKAGAICLYVQ